MSKKTAICIMVVMTVFTLVTMCAVGTWSAWYPWPPPEGAGDVQNAVWITWFWAIFIPTFVVDATLMSYGDRKKWWD